MDVRGMYCTELYSNVLECSLHDFFNSMQSILRYVWDSCRFLGILAPVNHFFLGKCVNSSISSERTKQFNGQNSSTVRPGDFSLRWKRSLQTEIKVAKLLQKRHGVLVDNFFSTETEVRC